MIISFFYNSDFITPKDWSDVLHQLLSRFIGL